MSENPVVFKVDASRINVKVGDEVLPETVIGEDVESGEEILAGIHGIVDAVQFSGSEHAMMVVVRPISLAEADEDLDLDDLLEDEDEDLDFDFDEEEEMEEQGSETDSD